MPQESETLTLLEMKGQVDELTAAVADLRAQLTAAQGRAELTLRGTCRCPACGGRRVLRADSVLDRSDSGRTKMALLQPSIWRVKGAGEFEVYLCADCGLVEWYVKDPEELLDHLELQAVPSAQEEGGPYR